MGWTKFGGGGTNFLYSKANLKAISGCQPTKIVRLNFVFDFVLKPYASRLAVLGHVVAENRNALDFVFKTICIAICGSRTRGGREPQCTRFGKQIQKRIAVVGQRKIDCFLL